MNYYPYLPFASFAGLQPQLLNHQQYALASMQSSTNGEDAGRPWMDWEDQRLKMAADKFSGKGWRKICITAFPDGSRTKEECLKRWRQVTKSVSVKGLWTTEEDAKLTALVGELGAEKWVAIANRLGTRTGKQCRERWHNHLDPRINKAPFTPEEEQLIFQLHSQMGSKWAEMSKHLPGRSDNSIKNFYNTAMQRKRKMLHSSPSKDDIKRHKDTFAWQVPTNFPIRNIQDPFLGMRVITPPDTPQPAFDMYSQWPSYHPKMDILNLTPLADSSPALPQGSFERAVFDQPKPLSSQTSSSSFSNMFLSKDSQYESQQEPQYEQRQTTNGSDHSTEASNAPGYHLGLVGVNYNGLTDNDYMFMNDH
ncbi:hypothetical protein DSO57_1015361 [Entomophthora muscae]|uniref:Uncharacterized protein n=1 Tax=Entomophthora muscae TaxID=34485 RepID=A0ACC2S761_9FUNG|nr:hypothetical protein DSO57_1015361 [Entomophthora muscae]